MQELENLLTSLIQRGWKPFNYIWTVDRIEIDDNFEISIIFITWEFAYQTLRDLVVLESWLWQFACENEFIKNTEALPDTICGWYIDWDTWYDTIANQDNYEFRLLESALIPEEELGEFLLSNIVMAWNSK